MAESNARRLEAALVTLILLVALFHILTIREGHDWGGDFSMYILHAKNIAEGRPFGDTGYIYNPSHPSVSPRNYPPGFPLLLAPVYYTSGLNLQHMKLVPIFSFILSLFVVYATFRKKLSFILLFSLIAILGFNRFFWEFKDEILSDLPFLLFTYTCLYLSVKAIDWEGNWKRSVGLCLLAGIFLYMAYATRTIGIVLLPSIILQETWKTKRIPYKSVLVLMVFLALVSLQHVVLHSDGAKSKEMRFDTGPIDSYSDQIHFDADNTRKNIRRYGKDLKRFWTNGYYNSIALALFGIYLVFSLLGFLIRLRRWGIYEVFFVSYLIVILAWPGYQGTRFLIPLIPLYLFYAFYFVDATNRLRARSMLLKYGVPTALVALLSVTLVSYILIYHRDGLAPIKEGIHKAESVEMFDYVIQETDKNDVIIFEKPRVLSLLTSRRSSAPHRAKTDQELWNYFENLDASYLVEFIGESKYVSAFVGRNAHRCMRVFSNKDFNVYRIK